MEDAVYEQRFEALCFFSALVSRFRHTLDIEWIYRPYHEHDSSNSKVYEYLGSFVKVEKL